MSHSKDVVTTAMVLSRRPHTTMQAAPLLALPAPSPARAAARVAEPVADKPAPPRPPFFFSREPNPLKVGIRHVPSGTMTVTHAPLRQVMATLSERAGHQGPANSHRLEAVVVDWRHTVCAAFWP
ncbi:MAG: hypothetical protein HIU92_15855 [Proteobacteria bacterium]|nr:hypothetical protein [Pseudomonadota bacterium]